MRHIFKFVKTALILGALAACLERAAKLTRKLQNSLFEPKG